MHAVLPIVMVLIFGKATLGAMTAADWALFALNNIPKAVKTEAQIIAFLNSPAGRQMLAANGEAAIRWQNRQMEF